MKITTMLLCVPLAEVPLHRYSDRDARRLLTNVCRGFGLTLTDYQDHGRWLDLKVYRSRKRPWGKQHEEMLHWAINDALTSNLLQKKVG